MRNLEVAVRSMNTKTKDVHTYIYHLNEIEDGYTILCYSLKFHKYEKMLTLPEAKNNINQDKKETLSDLIAYLQVDFMEYSKKYDLNVTMTASPRLRCKYLVRTGKKNIHDITELVSDVFDWFHYGSFTGANNNSSRCI